ncbi:MAG TPA: BlaI/MecI/CopY family transcriptional regulator [Bryobacteraceae bacterium]|nr:BlaI/MecI/CopY family transcriptional regulator [Bryobacteraceae bacterium]
MKIRRPNPTTAELEILGVLWEHGPASVRDIQRRLNAVKPTGYTTVLKLLQIMHEKGLVSRDETTRPQIYSARRPREDTQRQLLSDLAQRAFGGSVKALVLQALATRKSSPAELEEMEALLDRMERNGK